LALESILVVDDDRDILDVFQMVLEDEGYHVVTASTGEQAVERAKETGFRVALLDIVLPDIRGDKVALELKRIDDSIEIVFITGYSEFKNCVDALGMGICDILLKPITVEELSRCVKEALTVREHNSR
jgi:DNA-binding NtrC family response regulator